MSSDLSTRTTAWTAVWDELVTTGLLGTDRRDPPDLPVGPGADLVDDALAPTPAARMAAAVAATVVARRAGITPAPPRPALQAPDLDARPVLPPAAARRWHSIVAGQPLLEPEWTATAIAAGWRPSPDVVVSMLRRAKRSAHRRGAALRFAGALGAWLIDQLPDLDPGRPGPDEPTPLAVPAELRAGFELMPEDFAAVIVAGLRDGTFQWAHRNVLLNTVAAVPPPFLAPLVDALRDGRPATDERAPVGRRPVAPLGLWESLLELAAERHAMLAELEPIRA